MGIEPVALRAGIPKDGTWCDQQLSTDTLVIEAGFDLSLID
jgi:hypothetical protein